MEAQVPVALLAAAQLVAVAALLGLVPALFATALRANRLVSVLGAAGATTAGVANALTGARLGDSANDAYLLASAVGLALLGGALLAAAPPLRGRPGPPAAVLAVAPLGAALSIALVHGAAGLLAGAGAWRRETPGRASLSIGLLLLGLAGVLAPAARSHQIAAVVLLAARLVGGLCVLAALGVLARTSVLSKIVYLVGLGILMTTVAVAGIVGSVVADRLSADQARQLRSAAAGAATDLRNDAATSQQLATLAAGCAPTAAAVTACAANIVRFASGNSFTAVVRPGAAASVIGGTLHLDRAALLELQAEPAIRDALANPEFVGSGFVLLHGPPTQLFAVGIASHRDPTASTSAPELVVVYGAAVDRARLSRAESRSTFDATVLSLPDGLPVASTLDDRGVATLSRAAIGNRVLAALPAGGGAVSRFGAGEAPSAGYAALDDGTSAVAALALSAPNHSVLHTEQLVLDLLFGALVVIGLLVGAGAIVIGRRAVEPVLRLTSTARAVGAGDLDARPDVGSIDEVGQLAEVFGQMTASLQAITGDLRDTAEAETATRARLTTVLDALIDALVVSDSHGVVTAINPAARDLLGEVVGSPVDRVIVDGDGRALEPGEGTLAAFGGPTPVAFSRAVLPDGQGAVHLLRDITAARQLERAKSEFLANASHELRTPLTPILGYADLLRRHPDLSRGQIGAMAASIGASTRRMSRVVDLLVDVAALDAGRMSAAPEALDVRAFVGERLTDWRARAPHRTADLGRRVATSLPPISADRTLLARAVDELLGNALTYTETGTSVTLRVAPGAPGRVLLSVRDEGPGLAEDKRDVLLGLFAQGDGSSTRPHSGLGLGLAFVARVAAVLGGRLDVESTPGAGATFTLDVPAAASDDAQDSAPRPEPNSLPPSATTASVSATGRAKAGRRQGGPTA